MLMDEANKGKLSIFSLKFVRRGEHGPRFYFHCGTEDSADSVC